MGDPSGHTGAAAEAVLIIAPAAQDAQAAYGLLLDQGIRAEIHPGGPALGQRVPKGVSTLLIAQEALTPDTTAALMSALRSQPDWSDLPLILMTASGTRDSATSAAVLDLLPSGNVTLLERPLWHVTLLSAVRVALRGRARQHKLRSLYERNLAVKNTIAEGLYTVDAEGKVVYMNPAAERLFGWSASELMGRKMHDMTHYMHPDGSPFPASECAGLQVLQRKITLRDHEDTFIRKDGSFFPVTYSAAPLIENGAPVGIVVSFRDDTERKQRETERTQLLESERAARSQAERANRLKDEFLATLSHELRTPLTAILGWVNLLQRAPSDVENVKHGVEVIGQSARTQTQLISDLLDMSRIVSGKMRLEVQRVELPAILDAVIQAVRPAADANGVRIERSIEPTAGAVNGDPGRLQQVVWNLLSNAVKFTPHGGRVQLGLARVGSHMEIRVSDNGKGIRADFLPHVFDRFRQADASSARRHGGLGLGLAIVKQLVEMHGGEVTAASRGENEGATFTVHLPVATLPALTGYDEDIPPAGNLMDKQAPYSLTELTGIRVLIVEDDPDARDVIRRILEESQAEVVVAASADEALEALGRWPPDVVVSDIGMPGQDGYQFIRRARAAGHNMPAAALTAFARSEDRARALRSGYQTHVSKPVEATELTAAVAALALPARGKRNGPRRPSGDSADSLKA